MKAIFNTSALLVCILLMASCEKEITLDLPGYDSKLVINGELNSGQNIEVEISRSIPILDRVDSSGYLLKDATAKLYENNIYKGNFTYSNFKYTYPLMPVQGRTYRIEVSRADLKPAYVDVLIPNSFPTNSTYNDSVGVDNFGFPIGQLKISFQDNASISNYYQMSIRTYNSFQATWSPFIPDSNDPVFINNSALNNGTYIFSDATFNGQNKSFTFSVPFGTVSELPGVDKFEISIKTFSEEYYRYLEQVKDYDPVSNTFDTDPIIFKSNVTNGLGMVGGVYNDKDTIR